MVMARAVGRGGKTDPAEVVLEPVNQLPMSQNPTAGDGDDANESQ